MVDRESKPARLKHLLTTQQNIRYGRPVGQEDIKEAVIYANELNRDPRVDFSQLALDIGHRHLWTYGTERQISLEPDEELAGELQKLQKHALQVLNVKGGMIPEIDCNYQPRNRYDIQQDQYDIEFKYQVVSQFLGELIMQVTPR